MRDNYVGDVGDYFKYGMLRALCGKTTKDHFGLLKLGIAWYLYPDPCKITDGKYLQYLNPEKRNRFQKYDPELYDQLSGIIRDDARKVSEVRKRDIFPAGTSFHEEPLSLLDLPTNTQLRLAYRQQWLQGALNATKDADFVFFDPDNGLEIKSTPKHRNKGPKFTFYDELQPFWQRGQSLVIYQHATRQGTIKQQIENRLSDLRDKVGTPSFANVIQCGMRFFLIMAQQQHADALKSRHDTFSRVWVDHIS